MRLDREGFWLIRAMFCNTMKRKHITNANFLSISFLRYAKQLRPQPVLPGSSRPSQWQQACGYDDGQVVVTSLVLLKLVTKRRKPCLVQRDAKLALVMPPAPVAKKFVKETWSLALQERKTMDDQTAALKLLENIVACKYIV